MSAWILIGYLTYSGGNGGPFSAEFASEQACRAAIQAVEGKAREQKFSMYGRLMVCVPKELPHG